MGFSLHILDIQHRINFWSVLLLRRLFLLDCSFCACAICFYPRELCRGRIDWWSKRKMVESTNIRIFWTVDATAMSLITERAGNNSHVLSQLHILSPLEHAFPLRMLISCALWLLHICYWLHPQPQTDLFHTLCHSILIAELPRHVSCACLHSSCWWLLMCLYWFVCWDISVSALFILCLYFFCFCFPFVKGNDL